MYLACNLILKELLFDLEFKRKFSLSMYKDLKINLARMSFFKDFTDNTRGDLYPVVFKSEDCEEKTENNLYTVKCGSVKRLVCQFFPFATYELTAQLCGGETGFCFKLPMAETEISVRDNKLIFGGEEYDLPDFLSNDFTLIVSCRPGAFDIYFGNNGKTEFFKTFYDSGFQNSNTEMVFKNSYVYLLVKGNAVIKQVSSYIDNGVSIADIRPIKYENGEVMIDGGKVYFTASVRMQENSFEGVFSWVPGTAEFALTGAVFYDSSDGVWRNYVAPVMIYNRKDNKWYVWVSSFEHKHILAFASFDGDVRFGVNVIDVKFMNKAETDDITAFAGIKGDEDPDIIYDEENNRWLMAICRIIPESKKYGYVFFESDTVFGDYKYIGKGLPGEETGGSFVKAEGKIHFICGNGFSNKSEYRIYSEKGMKNASFNYPDGGFRGWGTVVPVKQGSRTRYFWLTFDRTCGSDYNWSYGNLYCFEI